MVTQAFSDCGDPMSVVAKGPLYWRSDSRKGPLTPTLSLHAGRGGTGAAPQLLN